jgi:hypothetical protein
MLLNKLGLCVKELGDYQTSVSCQIVEVRRVPECLSPRLYWDPPTPSPPESVPSPRNQRKGGYTHKGGGAVTIQTTGEKLSTLSTQWSDTMLKK